MQVLPRAMTALLAAAVLLAGGVAGARAQGILENSAVVLTYFHIGEPGLSTANLGLDDFHEHLVEMKEPDLTPLPVPQIARLLQQKKELPDGAIGVTFDAPYKALLERAIPALLERDIPFTVFLSPAMIDGQSTQYMSWADIETLKRSGHASFGLTLPATPADEADMKRALNKGIARYREMMQAEPKLFAYPQGQYTEAMKAAVRQAGFTAAFGLQSGAMHEGSDFMALPRFTMTGAYGDLERLEGIVRSLPLPVTDVEPQASLLDTEEALIGFSLPPEYRKLAPAIRCLASNQGPIEPQILGDSRIELRPRIGWGERLRVNCTVSASPDDPKSETLRWIGFLLFSKDAAAGPDANNPEQGGLPPPPE